MLAIGFLPVVLKRQDLALLQSFESRYEKVGMPALLLLVITGVWMALDYLPFTTWFNWQDHMSQHISLKLLWLAITLGLAAHARLRIIPKLNEKKLPLLAAHIIAITIVSVLFVITGLSIRLYFW